MTASVTIGDISNSLQQTLSANAQQRKQAEQQLSTLEQAPGFVVPLLQLVNNQTTDSNIRFAAALYFKNLVKRRWPNSKQPQDDGNEDNVISEDDRRVIKSEIVSLMISVPKQLQLQIGEAVSIMADSDFPAQWPELINELISKLSATDFHINNGILQTAHTVFKGWRSEFRSDELYTKINYVLSQFTDAYMQVFVATDKLIGENANSKESLKVLLHSMNLLCQIYYDLNCQDLPPFFEDHMGQFMDTFHKYLVYTNPNVIDDDEDEIASDLEEVKASICEIIELYAQRYEEVFTQLPQFVKTVWEMLTTVGPQHKYDSLVSKGMAFLRTVVRNPGHKDLFASEESLNLVCERIILPNMLLPEADVELFEDDPIQFVRRDIEAHSAGSRREAAADLVRGMLEQFSAQTTRIMSTYIQKGLEQYAANPSAQWRDKDAALFMVTSVAVVASVHSLGATKINELVNVGDFFHSHIVQHLKDIGSDAHAPILKVDAIKYVLTFRNQLPRDVLAQVLPLLGRHLQHDNPVVSTISAICIERLLVLKKDGKLRFGPNDIGSMAGEMLGSIFTNITKNSDTPQKLAENDYLMKAVMRLILASRTNIMPIAGASLEQLSQILTQVSKNPSNPKFSHYMFESIASLARFACAADARAVGQFESTLFPIFQMILQEDVSEFMPYVFQILAQLLSMHQSQSKGRLPDAYIALLSPLLQPTLWASQGNIPALVRLLQSYMQIGGQHLAQEGQLQPILGIFQRLIASKANDHQGFNLLLAITQFSPVDALKQYLKPILTLCLNRLQSSRTTKFTRNFVHYIGSILCIDAEGGSGVTLLLDAMDSIQPGLFATILNNILLEAIPSVLGRVERKTTVVGFSLLVGSNRFQSTQAYAELTGPLLRQLATMLMDTKVQDTKSLADRSTNGDGSAAAVAAIATDEDLDSLEIEDTGYQASFARLATLGDIKIDPCPKVTDARAGFGQILRPVQSQISGAVQQLPEEIRRFIAEAVAL